MVTLRRRPSSHPAIPLLSELVLRVLLLALFVFLERQHPFFRQIHKEEAWLYANPMTESYVPASLLWPMVAIVPVVVIAAVYLVTANLADAGAAALCASLLLPLNGVVTDVIKLSVGRPRPDFLQRCWPDGNVPVDAFGKELSCSGELTLIVEGRKSFPSGHSSFSFATFGFVFFYISGKLKTFSIEGKGRLDSIRMVVSVFVLLIPTCIAISRTCDYHHHWQDVVAGSILGFLLSWMVYRFYYPPLASTHCDQPYTTGLVKKTQPLLQKSSYYGGADLESGAAGLVYG